MTSGHAEVASWAIYRDERRGFGLSFPPDWEPVRGMAGLLVSIAGVSDEKGFRPNLNVVRRANDRALDLDGLLESSLTELGRVLTDMIVIDASAVVVAHHPARHLIVTHRQGAFSLTSQQWMFVTDEHVWTVSASCTTEDYATLANLFTGVVASLSVSG